MVVVEERRDTVASAVEHRRLKKDVTPVGVAVRAARVPSIVMARAQYLGRVLTGVEIDSRYSQSGGRERSCRHGQCAVDEVCRAEAGLQLK